MMEEEAAYEPPTSTPTYSYDEVFPALPESAPGDQPSSNQMGQWNNKMRVGSSVVTQVFRVPYEERRLDQSERFGECDSKGKNSSNRQSITKYIDCSLNSQAFAPK
jgi:hypothetical protein